MHLNSSSASCFLRGQRRNVVTVLWPFVTVLREIQGYQSHVICAFPPMPDISKPLKFLHLESWVYCLQSTTGPSCKWSLADFWLLIPRSPARFPQFSWFLSLHINKRVNVQNGASEQRWMSKGINPLHRQCVLTRSRKINRRRTSPYTI